MTNSRQKGKRGELEWAHFLTDHGHPARRGQQHRGGADSPDVICESLPIHWEVKRRERFQLYQALEQAANECPDGSTPVVAHRKNGKEWVVIMRAEDFMANMKRPHGGDA